MRRSVRRVSTSTKRPPHPRPGAQTSGRRESHRTPGAYRLPTLRELSIAATVTVWVTWVIIIGVHWQFPVTVADIGWDFMATIAAPSLTALVWLRPLPRGCTGQQFERIVVHALIRQRCRVRHVGGAGDGGVDILATWPGRRLRPWVKMRPMAIQVKHTAEVSLGPLRELVAATGHDGRYRGRGRMLITTGHVTPAARIYAGRHWIVLIEREHLEQVLGRRTYIPVPEPAIRRHSSR